MFKGNPALTPSSAVNSVMPATPTHRAIPPLVKTADEYLKEGAQVLKERGKTYDKSGNEAERSMEKCVKVFNELTGNKISETDGWMFMMLLKMTRIYQSGGKHEDSGVDMINYAALATESMMRK